jgi:hypothetical protein
MIKTTYTSSKVFTERAQILRVDTFDHLRGNFLHYLAMYALLGLLIQQVDEFFGNGMRLSLALVPVVVCSAIFALVARRQWIQQVRDNASTFTVEVEADDTGVRSRIQPDVEFTSWNKYLWYEDTPDALLLKHQSGTISLVPKNEATAEIIAFTRGKVSPRYPSTAA